MLLLLLLLRAMLGNLVRSAVPLRVEARGESFDCFCFCFLFSRFRELSTAALAIGCCLVTSMR
jgi:hypothetical protein